MEAEFTSSSGGVRAPLVKREIGTERRETMRNRFEPGQVAQGGFRARANRSYPEGNRLLLCTSTGGSLGCFPMEDNLKKAPKGETMKASAPRRKRGRQGSQPFQNAGDVEKNTDGL